MGGHNMPEETIRRRYHAGLKNFFNLYRELADSWFFYDNSQSTGPILQASGQIQAGINITDAVVWEQIRREYDGCSL